ncbi:alpha/beta hydrolase [Salimicrobium sp. PL1-032A]|uniref:alpha/beta hydrolase n=1 Tax=Salimicrobium sp. PL1-032A TaxID=3095364 RepID=UPI003260E4DA
MSRTVDEQVLALLAEIGAKMKDLGHPPLDQLTPEESRWYYRVAREYFTGVDVDGVTAEDTFFYGRDGHDIPVRIYEPEGEGPFPVLVYFHGGGWVFGDIDSADNVCRRFAGEAQAVIVSVGYRLAPEHKYPAAFHDAVDAVAWTFRNLGEWNGDHDRVAIGGESSGGNLAAAAASYFLEHGDTGIAAQLLITPVLNYDFRSASYQADYQYNLTNEKMKWFFGHYLNDASEGEDIYVSPLRKRNLEELPRTLLVTAHFDPLREEGHSYARRLKASGVQVDHLHYEDLVHSFMNMTGVVARAEEAFDETTRYLKNLLHKEVRVWDITISDLY